MPGDRLPGFYRGTVMDVDDPEGLLRLRVKVPQVLGEAVTDWAWPSIPVAMGVLSPAEGDPVWIAFEGGDIERPIWTGVWRTYKPAGADPDINFGGVVSETTYGLASSNGTASTIARSDHTHGTPSLTGAAPTTIMPDDSAAVGTGTTPARHDHRHAIATIAPGLSTPGDTADEGASTAFARADHRHEREAPGAEIPFGAPMASLFGDQGAEGVSPNPARADHRHDRTADARKLYSTRLYARANFR